MLFASIQQVSRGVVVIRRGGNHFLVTASLLWTFLTGGYLSHFFNQYTGDTISTGSGAAVILIRAAVTSCGMYSLGRADKISCTGAPINSSPDAHQHHRHAYERAGWKRARATEKSLWMNLASFANCDKRGPKLHESKHFERHQSRSRNSVQKLEWFPCPLCWRTQALCCKRPANTWELPPKRFYVPPNQ